MVEYYDVAVKEGRKIVTHVVRGNTPTDIQQIKLQELKDAKTEVENLQDRIITILEKGEKEDEQIMLFFKAIVCCGVTYGAWKGYSYWDSE